MDVRSPFIQDPLTAKLMQPRQCALDHPTINAQPAAVRHAASGQNRLDAQCSRLPAMGLRIVTPVPLHAFRSEAGPTPFDPHWRDGLDQCQQLRHIMAIDYPTVPQGKARIRVMISAAHSREDLDKGLEAFARVGESLGVI